MQMEPYESFSCRCERRDPSKQDHGCGYFKWKDEITFGNTSSFPRPSTPSISSSRASSSSGLSGAALSLGNVSTTAPAHHRHRCCLSPPPAIKYDSSPFIVNWDVHVVDELLKRRKEFEWWFIEGDFDLYVKRIKKPYVWGGEPELLMASHIINPNDFMDDASDEGDAHEDATDLGDDDWALAQLVPFSHRKCSTDRSKERYLDISLGSIQLLTNNKANWEGYRLRGAGSLGKGLVGIKRCMGSGCSHRYIIVLSSDTEDINEDLSKRKVPKGDINEGPSKGKLPPLGSSARPRPKNWSKISKDFQVWATTGVLRWYGYADMDEFLEDPFFDSLEKKTKDKSSMDTFPGSTYEESSENETTVGTTGKDLLFNEDTMKRCGMSMLSLADISAPTLLCLTYSITHNFLWLKEGSVYLVKNFTVVPNKDEFRVIGFDDFMLEFNGETTTWKAFLKFKGFTRYPFQLVEIDELEPTNNKYLIDVVGCVTNVGRITQTRTCSKTLDFYMVNCRGQQIRATLWGGLVDMLIEKRTRHVGLYPIVITAMSVKLYNNRLYLSSTSSTPIVDDANIPVLMRLKTDDSGVALTKVILPVDNTMLNVDTLENLLMWARNQKYDSATFLCKVKIDKVRTKKGCNYPSCGEINDEEANLGLPTALANIVGISHTLELKSHAYYEHMNYESFTCWKVVIGEDVKEEASYATATTNNASKATELKKLNKAPAVATLSKPGEEKKRGGNNHADRPSLSNILHTSVTIHSNIIIRRDRTVQSFCGIRLLDISISNTGTSSKLAKGDTGVEKRSVYDTPDHLISKAGPSKTGTEVSSHNLGAPTCQYRGYNAIMCYRERVNKGNKDANPTFSLCCQQGKILLPRFNEALALENRLLNYSQPATSSFRDQIRVYNGIFYFTSFRARIDHSINIGRGLYTFRINGQNYQRSGSLLPKEGTQPRYDQLWFFNIHNEIRNRLGAFMDQDNGDGVDETIVGSLIKTLDQNSAIAKAFRMARDCAPTVAEVVALITNDFRDGKRKTSRGYVTMKEYYAYVIQYGKEQGMTLLKGWRLYQQVFRESHIVFYVVEFQMRGLPHAHILLWLKEHDKCKTLSDIDDIISAELPSPMDDPEGTKLSLTICCMDHVEKYTYPSMMKLNFHLPNQHPVTLRDSECLIALFEWEGINVTMFTDWFDLNERHPQARTLTYAKFQSIMCGPCNFEELLTVNKRLCTTFKETCFAYGLLNDDREWTRGIQEASLWALGP
nr:hypothetical protein [Tanacetum cinerariifolium]